MNEIRRSPLRVAARTLLVASLYCSVSVGTLASAKGVPTHCVESEQVIFSCAMKGTKKTLSICASKSLEGAERFLQYRYGALGAVELQYPNERFDSISQFKLSHYFRAQVDRRELTFTFNGTRYSVFSDFNGEDKPPQRLAGVSVSVGTGRPKILQCVRRYVDKLVDLDDFVPCDPKSSFGEGECAQ